MTQTDPAVIVFLADRDAPCPGCGYNLRGLTAPVCPECTRPVSLQLASDPIPKLRRPLIAAPLLTAAMMLTGAVYSLYVMFRWSGAGFSGYSYFRVMIDVGSLCIGGFAAYTGWLSLGMVRSRTPATTDIARCLVYVSIAGSALTLLNWLGYLATL